MQAQHVPFINCLESFGPTLVNSKLCASILNLCYESIESCVNGNQGNALEHEMAIKTDALNPPHQSVPWFTMNGVHKDEIQQGLNTNMLNYVCNAYTGTRPVECTEKRHKECY